MVDAKFRREALGLLWLSRVPEFSSSESASSRPQTELRPSRKTDNYPPSAASRLSNSIVTIVVTESFNP